MIFIPKPDSKTFYQQKIRHFSYKLEGGFWVRRTGLTLPLVLLLMCRYQAIRVSGHVFLC
jgi:hypothetical protein